MFVFLVVLGFLCWGVCFACFWIPHGLEITPVVCEVVCEVERPSALSWRARHGRKKIAVVTPLLPPLAFYPASSCLSPSLLSSCHPARAGRHGRSKVILLTLANTDPQVIFWPSCTSRSTSCTGLSGCASPSGASLQHLSWSLWFVTTSLTSAFT